LAAEPTKTMMKTTRHQPHAPNHIKRAPVSSERKRRLVNAQTAETDGNIYYPSLSLLKDARRKYNGSSKNSRSKTWFTRLFA
jgi:hypothetical protein